MSFPVYVQLGSLSLHPHAFFETLAYLAGFALFLRSRQTPDVVSGRQRTWVVTAAVLGGIAGSRLLYLAEDPLQLALRWRDPAFLLSGKSIVGGLVGGLCAVEWAKVRLGVAVATGDLFVLPLTLGIAVGRIGCFLTGLGDGTHGLASDLPWAVDFGDGIPRHPTQLYEVAFLAGLGLFFVSRGSSLPVPGDRFKLFMVSYAAFRLAVDGFKPAVQLAGLSVIQWACAAMLIYYARHVPRLVAQVRHG